MSMMRNFAAAAAALAIFAAVPAAAQHYSDSYTFFKAVKERDGAKAKSVIDQPGSTILNMRDMDSGDTALIMVTKGRDGAWMNFLIANGADVNGRSENGSTPLMHAAQIGFVEGIEILLGRGANPNIANDRGETALILAVQQRNLPAVRALLAAGADPDVTDHVAGLSARDYAERDRRAAAIARLIKDNEGKKTPVMGPQLPN